MPIPVQPNAIERLSAKERVFNTLQQWIVYGTLLPGEKLNDVELAKYFSVSRTPVREAIQLLSEQKLVVIQPSSGTYVAKIDLEDMAHAYHLLADLQALAAESIKSPIPEEDIGILTELNDLFYHNAKFGKPADAMETDGKFHHHIAELTGNPYLVKFTDELMVQAHRNEVQFFRSGYHTEESYQTHNRIIEALTSGNSTEAAELLRANWEISLT